MTIRDVADYALSYLRTEQRAIPVTEANVDDPMDAVVMALNAALQTMAVYSPTFACKRGKSAWFRAAATVSLTGLSNGSKVATCASWPAWAVGNPILLPGDTATNRIVSISGNVATLQFPYLGSLSSGSGTLSCDTAVLDSDVIRVIDPVATREGVEIRPATGPHNRLLPVSTEIDDYGWRRVQPIAGADQAYTIESEAVDGQGYLSLRMQLRTAVAADFVVGFQARCIPRVITVDDVHDGSPNYADPGVSIPVPAQFVETIYLPLVVHKFLGSPVVQNWDVPGIRNADAMGRVQEAAQQALDMLERMRPQGRKRIRMYPGL